MSNTQAAASGPSISDAVDLIKASTDIDRLLVLDDFWSECLNPEVTTAAHPDTEQLAQLAQQMGRDLDIAVEATVMVRGILESATDESIDQGIAVLAPQFPDNSIVQWIVQEDLADISTRAFFIGVCSLVQREHPDERAILSGKLEQLATGEYPDPDLRPFFKCALALVPIAAGAALAAAGAVTVVGAIPAAGLGVVVAAGGAAKTWSKNGCPRGVKRAVIASA